jgi:tetratricopeptide (TPR) repeat protein
MGDLEKDTFQWAKASEYYALAREQWQRAPEPKSDPHVLLGIEDAALMRNGEERARTALTQARKIYDQLGDKAGIADIAMIGARLELNLGRIDLARAQFADARALFLGAGAREREGDAGLQIAGIDIRRGYNRQAVEFLTDARAAFEAAASPIGIARVQMGWGDLERLQGRLDVARKHYADAAALLASTGNRAEAEALRKLGQLEMAVGNRDAATAALDKAIATAARTGWREEEAAARVAAAVVARDAGNAAAANAHATAANTLFDQTRNAEGRARSAVVGATEANGFADAAQRSRAANLPVGVVQAQLGLGDALRANGNAADAAAAYREAEAAWNTLNNKLVEANRFLDLPPVDGLYIVGIRPMAADYEVDAHPEDYEPDPVLVRANMDEFPDHNIEARRLVEQVDKRLAAALGR